MPEIATPERVLEYWFGRPAETEAEVIAQIKRWFLGRRRGAPGSSAGRAPAWVQVVPVGRPRSDR